MYAADQLFATLDPTVRRMESAAGPLALSDTVGFVRDLPHDLVAAFRSTLSEARDADLLLHVVDAADPRREERIGQVDEVLAEIGAGDIPQLLVFNKIDRLEEARAAPRPGRAAKAAASGCGCRRAAAPAWRRCARRWRPGSATACWAAKSSWPRAMGACARACTPWERCVRSSRTNRRLAPAPGVAAGPRRAPGRRSRAENPLRPLLLVAPGAPTYNP